MRLLLRCLVIAILFVAVLATASALTFAEPFAIFGWPGLLVVNAVCAKFEIYAGTTGNFGLMFGAGLALDILIYTLLFFAVIKGWRAFAPKSVARR